LGKLPDVGQPTPVIRPVLILPRKDEGFTTNDIMSLIHGLEPSHSP